MSGRDRSTPRSASWRCDGESINALSHSDRKKRDARPRDELPCLTHGARVGTGRLGQNPHVLMQRRDRGICSSSAITEMRLSYWPEQAEGDTSVDDIVQEEPWDLTDDASPVPLNSPLMPAAARARGWEPTGIKALTIP